MRRLGDSREFLVWLKDRDIKIEDDCGSKMNFGGEEIIKGDIH